MKNYILYHLFFSIYSICRIKRKTILCFLPKVSFRLLPHRRILLIAGEPQKLHRKKRYVSQELSFGTLVRKAISPASSIVLSQVLILISFGYKESNWKLDKRDRNVFLIVSEHKRQSGSNFLPSIFWHVFFIIS